MKKCFVLVILILLCFSFNVNAYNRVTGEDFLEMTIEERAGFLYGMSSIMDFNNAIIGETDNLISFDLEMAYMAAYEFTFLINEGEIPLKQDIIISLFALSMDMEL